MRSGRCSAPEGSARSGGATAGIEIQSHDRVTLQSIIGWPTCPGVQSGAHAVAATRLTVKNCQFYAYNAAADNRAGCPPEPFPGIHTYADAAVHIDGTPAGAGIRIATNFVCAGETTAVLLENTADAARARTPVTLQRNSLLYDARGIVLRASDGTAIRANTVRTYPSQVVGITGIDLDADSDDNVLAQDKVSGYVTDVSDAGSSNCWRSTTFDTGSIPAGGCP